MQTAGNLANLHATSCEAHIPRSLMMYITIWLSAALKDELTRPCKPPPAMEKPRRNQDPVRTELDDSSSSKSLKTPATKWEHQRQNGKTISTHKLSTKCRLAANRCTQSASGVWRVAPDRSNKQIKCCRTSLPSGLQLGARPPGVRRGSCLCHGAVQRLAVVAGGGRAVHQHAGHLHLQCQSPDA
jgi:hypothetical protein